MDAELFPGLPNEIGIMVLVRVPYRDIATARQVSFLFRLVLTSPHFYRERRRLGLTEDVLCARIRTVEDAASRWMSLHRHPARFDGLPELPVPELMDYAVASAGGTIYVTGGRYGGLAPFSNHVWVLDVLRSDRWVRGPDMIEAHRSPIATALDGRVYVIRGGRAWPNLIHIGEWFDQVDGQWHALPSLPRPINNVVDAAPINGQLWVWTNTACFSFDPPTVSWSEMPLQFPHHARMLDGIWYAGRDRDQIRVFDPLDPALGWDLASRIDPHPASSSEFRLIVAGARLFAVYEREEAHGLHHLRVTEWISEIRVGRHLDDNGGTVMWSQRFPSPPHAYSPFFDDWAVLLVNV